MPRKLFSPSNKKVLRGEKSLIAQQLNLLLCFVAKPWKFHSLTARFVIGKSLSKSHLLLARLYAKFNPFYRQKTILLLFAHAQWLLKIVVCQCSRKSIRTRSFSQGIIQFIDVSQMRDRGDKNGWGWNDVSEVALISVQCKYNVSPIRDETCSEIINSQAVSLPFPMTVSYKKG